MRKAREPKSLARLVSRRAEPIEYRPHAQHRLQSYDDTFDLRYSAYLWSQAVIEGVYLRVIEKASHDVSTKLSSILNSLHFVPAAAGGVEVVHVSTGELRPVVFQPVTFFSLLARSCVLMSLLFECLA